jgi:hypothetical protein
MASTICHGGKAVVWREHKRTVNWFMRHAVHNRATETLCVFDASGDALRGQLRNAAAIGKSYTKGKRLARAWRTPTLLSPLKFSRADGHGRDSFGPNYGMFRTSLALIGN